MQVVARGIVISSGQVEVKNQNPITISVPVITNMAPAAHIIAYYVRGDGEVVADALAFGVEEVFDNKVQCTYQIAHLWWTNVGQTVTRYISRWSNVNVPSGPTLDHWTTDCEPTTKSGS